MKNRFNLSGQTNEIIYMVIFDLNIAIFIYFNNETSWWTFFQCVYRLVTFLTGIGTGKFWNNVIELIGNNIGLMNFGPLGGTLERLIWVYNDYRGDFHLNSVWTIFFLSFFSVQTKFRSWSEISLNKESSDRFQTKIWTTEVQTSELHLN